MIQITGISKHRNSPIRITLKSAISGSKVGGPGQLKCMVTEENDYVKMDDHEQNRNFIDLDGPLIVFERSVDL